MTQMLVLVGLTVVQLACGTVAPVAAAITTTPAISCNTPLCMGLVGAGVGAAGLAAIGGIAAAAAHKKKAPAAAAPVTPAPVVTPAPTLAPMIFNRNAETTTAAPSSSGGWLLPLLSGLLLLCCLLGLIGYLCMKPKQKRATKVKKTVAPVENRELAAAEAAPLLATGHWEQPKQIVPVTTAQTSMVPQVTTAQVAMAAAPTYAMPAPAYTEAVVPSYAMVPTPTYAQTVAPAAAYAMPQAYAGGYGVPTAGYGVPSGAIY